MAAFGQDIQTHDFGAAAATNVSFTLPAGHTIVEVYSAGLTFATGPIILRVGDPTVKSGASDYREGGMEDDNTWDIAANKAYLARLIQGAQNKPFKVQLWNMQTAAPVVCQAVGFGNVSDGGTVRHGLRRSITEHSVVEIRNSAGTNITAGIVRLISYKRKNKVTAKSAATTVTWTGLTKAKSGILVVATYDQVFANAQGAGSVRTAGGGNCRRWYGGANFKEGVLGGQFNMCNNGTAGTDGSHFHISYSFPEEVMHSCCMHSADMSNGSSFGPLLRRGYREIADSNDTIQDVQTTGPTGGTLYLVEYQV